MLVEFNQITKLTQAEQLQILDWRNSENVRACMLNQDIISVEDHLSYCENLKKNKSTLFFQVSVNRIPCGIVNFTNLNEENKTGEYGIYLVDKTKNIGVNVGRLAVYYFFEFLHFFNLKIRVLSSNRRAILYFERLLHFRKNYLKEKALIGEKNIEIVQYYMDYPYWTEIVKKIFSNTFLKTDFIVDGYALNLNKIINNRDQR